ncbi:MAG: 4-hydroxy-3-methylbut-2-enyl diphosphate reductase [Bacteroidales bacterium]
MQVEVDEKSGFCFGVRNAVEIAEEALARGEKVFSLGQIVHNDIEVERLYSLGLVPVNKDQFMQLRDCKVLIRAHGEPPETYAIALENNITIIEATCPIVSRLQQRIKMAWEKTRKVNGQVVIFGKAGHAEVIGLIGQTEDEAILTDGEKNLDKIDYTKEIHLFSQTTMPTTDYFQLAEKIADRIRETDPSNQQKLLHINRTICGQVSNREPGLRAFSRKHDIIIFIGGKESSNGKMLFSVCKSENPDSYFISSPDELKKEWFTGKNSAGVCGATSTPKWLIDKTRDAILSI